MACHAPYNLLRGVIVCCAFCVCHICEDGGACVVIIYVCAVARVSPLTCDYYNVLYGAVLRFCAQNRYFKSILLSIIFWDNNNLINEGNSLNLRHPGAEDHYLCCFKLSCLGVMWVVGKKWQGLY